MKRTALLLSVFGISALSLLAQDGPQGERRGRGPGGPGGMMMRGTPAMRVLDVDGDGVISADEIRQAAASFAKLDQNGDGKITEDEVRPQGGRGMGEGRRPGGPEGQNRRPGGERGEGQSASPEDTVNTMMQFDKNGDGKLDKSEVPERMQGIFARADANKDGILTRDELLQSATKQAARQQEGPGGGRGGFSMMKMDPVMAALDADQNGEISQKEWQAAPKVLLKLDKNGDGQLTPDEIRPNFPQGGPGGRRGGGPEDH